MNRNTTRQGTDIEYCPGSGAQATRTYRDHCPVCHTLYRLTRQDTIRRHVSRQDRYRADMQEGHRDTRELIAELAAKYGEVTA